MFHTTHHPFISRGFFQRVCWILGGFDSAVLGAEACRTVRAKYSCMGVLVLMTASLACLSASYALDSIFHSVPLGILVGIIWSTLIFSLDRFFVSSTRKIAIIDDYYPTLQTSPPYRLKASWVALMIRITLALLIGVIVSKPLEVRILQAWIAESEQEHADADKHNRTSSTEVVEDEQAVIDLSGQLKAKGETVEQRRTAAALEMDGQAASKKQGQGSIYQTKREFLNKAEGEYTELQQRLDAAKKKADASLNNAKTDAVSVKVRRDEELSIITGLEDIEKLKRTKERGSLTWWVSVFITLLFVVVETIPVLAKALSPYDPYDAQLQQFEHGAILQSLADVRRIHATTLTRESI